MTDKKQTPVEDIVSRTTQLMHLLVGRMVSDIMGALAPAALKELQSRIAIPQLDGYLQVREYSFRGGKTIIWATARWDPDDPEKILVSASGCPPEQLEVKK